MTPLEELRSIGSFSGAMFKVLEDFDARLKAVEAHVPMLNELKPHFEEQQRAIAEQEAANAEPPALPDAATPDSVGTGVEPLDVLGGVTPDIFPLPAFQEFMKK